LGGWEEAIFFIYMLEKNSIVSKISGMDLANKMKLSGVGRTSHYMSN
jgi:hypothetical protein